MQKEMEEELRPRSIIIQQPKTKHWRGSKKSDEGA